MRDVSQLGVWLTEGARFASGAWSARWGGGMKNGALGGGVVKDGPGGEGQEAMAKKVQDRVERLQAKFDAQDKRRLSAAPLPPSLLKGSCLLSLPVSCLLPSFSLNRLLVSPVAPSRQVPTRGGEGLEC